MDTTNRTHRSALAGILTPARAAVLASLALLAVVTMRRRALRHYRPPPARYRGP